MTTWARSTWFVIFMIFGGGAAGLQAQGPEPGVPHAVLQLTTTIQMPAEPDSNSPVVWRNLGAGGNLFTIFSSTWQGPSVTRGSVMMPAGPPTLVDFVNRPPYNHWFEAMVPAADQTWYGFYHYEVPSSTVCPNDHRHMPAIGAARSFDFGQTWEDLGVILRAPIGSHLCSTINTYFVGGVGDFSAVLHPTDNYLYLFYSQYSNVVADQGVAVARMPWADRDAPVGKVTVYRNGRWEPAFVPEGSIVPGVTPAWQYVSGTPIFPVPLSWHSTDGIVDAFWGPSVHWNTHLNRFVMLLNRASDTTWTQEGIYISYAKNGMVEWTRPKRLMAGGSWYPQVVGTEVGTGTDRLAGQSARLFVRGTSQYLIQFTAMSADPVKVAPVEASSPEVMASAPETAPAVETIGTAAPSSLVPFGFSTNGSAPGAVLPSPSAAAVPASAPPAAIGAADLLKIVPAVEPSVAADTMPAVSTTPAAAVPATALVAAREPEVPAAPIAAPVVGPAAPVGVRYPVVYAGLAPAPGGSRERHDASAAASAHEPAAPAPIAACGEATAAAGTTEADGEAQEPRAEPARPSEAPACSPSLQGATVGVTDPVPAPASEQR